MKYHLVTLGCAKNTVDSMRLERALRNGRHTSVETPEAADLLLVNTCGFIDAAKDESVEVVRALDEQRRPGQQLYVVGCMTQIAESEVRAAVPNVDATFGVEAWDDIAASIGPADSKYDIPQASSGAADARRAERVPEDLRRLRPAVHVLHHPDDQGRHALRHQRAADRRGAVARRRAGCASWCSSRRTRPRSVRTEASATASRRCSSRSRRRCREVPWLRLMYAYPGRVTPKLAETMARLPNVVPYLDMPLQHGSDAVLRRMKRPSLRVARASIDAMRTAMPDVTLRTTFIVGYPGETEQEFEELLAFVEEQRFDHVGAFTYSPQHGHARRQRGRPGARAREEAPLRAADGSGAAHRARAQPRDGRAHDGRARGVRVARRERGRRPVVVGRTVRDAPEVDGLALLKGTFAAGTIVQRAHRRRAAVRPAVQPRLVGADRSPSDGAAAPARLGFCGLVTDPSRHLRRS